MVREREIERGNRRKGRELTDCEKLKDGKITFSSNYLLQQA